MSYHRTRIAIGVCGFATAAVLVLVGTRLSPRLEGAEPPAGSPEVKKSLPDLLVELSHAIVRLDVWRPYQLKDAKSGKEVASCAWSAGTGFVIRCGRWAGMIRPTMSNSTLSPTNTSSSPMMRSATGLGLRSCNVRCMAWTSPVP